MKKEIWQLFRNPIMWQMICLMPVIQLMLFPYTADYEIKEVRLAIVDHDQSVVSQQLISKFEYSQLFYVTEIYFSQEEAMSSIERGRSDIIIEIPDNFERSLTNNQQPNISILANAINALDASIGTAYIGVILGDFAAAIAPSMMIDVRQDHTPIQMDIASQSWFNPKKDYKIFIIPGILAILVSLIGVLMTAINIVREKEMGTIEQINVTPVTNIQFILGKMIPFWIIGMLTFIVGLFFAKLIYSLPIEGNILTLLFFVSIFLIAMLGLGFFISIVSTNQIQAMFACLFLFVTFVMLGGLFTPLESMPQWAQAINIVNPFVYMVRASRMILLKGSGFVDILPDIIAVSVMAVVTNLSAIYKYRKIS